MNSTAQAPKHRTTPSREHALRWLHNNIQQWPAKIEGGRAAEIGQDKFAGWSFVRSSEDGVIYFANCIDRGIGETEFRGLGELIA